MRPTHWKKGDLTKLEQITEEGRADLVLSLMAYSRHYVEALADLPEVEREPRHIIAAITLETLLEALGFEGYEEVT